jgi:hypothetical protein
MRRMGSLPTAAAALMTKRRLPQESTSHLRLSQAQAQMQSPITTAITTDMPRHESSSIHINDTVTGLADGGQEVQDDRDDTEAE